MQQTLLAAARPHLVPLVAAWLFGLLLLLPGLVGAAPPTITSFSPASGSVGAVVTVTGTDLAGATAVRVGSTTSGLGTILSNTATSLTFYVGMGSVSGTIAVTTPGSSGGTGTSGTSFQVVIVLPPSFEAVDTTSTAANGGFTLLGTGPTAVFGGAFTNATQRSQGRGDDYYERIDLGFSFAFYGNTYTQCYINSNGCISFTQGVEQWVGYTFPLPTIVGVGGPIIAPYWADADTRHPNSGRIWYRLYPDRLVMLWSKVGYYDTKADKKNTFQVILRRNTVAPAPSADLTFNYGDLQWLLGDASNGAYPQIGFDAGDGTRFFNAIGTYSPQVLNYRGSTLNYAIGNTPQLVTGLPYVPVNIASFSPSPVGIGQEVTLTGTNLAGATGLTANRADATSTLTANTATSLSFRMPVAAILTGQATVALPNGTAQSAGLNVLPDPGHALSLDGTNDYASVPHAAALNLTSALTVEAWVLTSSATERYIVTKGEDSWLLAVNGGNGASGRASFYLNGPSTAGGWLHGTSTISDGHWHHVAGTYDGTTLKLYVDGILESSRAASGAVGTGSSALLLGRRNADATGWAGSLDEVRIWRTARTEAELDAGLYQPPGLPSAALVAYFNFDRGRPGGVNTPYTTFRDVVSGLVATTSGLALTGPASNYVESYAMVLPQAVTPASVLPTGFTLQWQPSARGSVMSYVAEASTSPAFTAPISRTAAFGTNSVSFTGLTAGTTYYYRLRAERTAVTGQGAYATGTLALPTAAGACGLTVGTFTPTTGAAGTLVTITGTGLLPASRVTSVLFGGVAASSFTVVDATTLQATVPAGAISGSISVRTSCGQSLSTATSFTAALPTITRVVPLAELPGQEVTLTGTNFVAGSSVMFGNQLVASVTYVSPTTLRAVVPVPLVGYSLATPVGLVTVNGNTPTSAFTTLAVAAGATPNACTAVPAVTNAADNAWHYVLSTEGQVVLAYNSQGRNLGTVGASYLQADPAQAVRRDAHGQYYLGRNWRLTTSAGAFTGNSVLVRYYGLNSEYNQLLAADPGHVAAMSSLRLTQYSGPNEDCTLANNNNTTGTSVLLTPTATYGPDGSGFFVAEATVPDHFSEFYLGATPTTPLPVELTTFTASLVPNQAAARLEWATAQEQNSAAFEVERSQDGTRFERVGTVAAAGNSTSARAYYLLDSRLPAGTQRLYYRLRMVDQDGSFRYSAVRTVQLTSRSSLAVYPNPSPGTATLTGAAPGTPVFVFDVLGRLVLRTTTDATGTVPLVLPTGMAAGVYAIRAGDAPAVHLVVE